MFRGCHYLWSIIIHGNDDDANSSNSEDGGKNEHGEREIYNPYTDIGIDPMEGGSGIKIEFDFTSREDSVEDDVYYDEYITNKYTTSMNNTEKSCVATKLLSMARIEANTHRLELTKARMDTIIFCYEQSISAAPKSSTLKRNIIREYELLKSGVSSELIQVDQQTIDESMVMATDFKMDDDVRRMNYRKAIRLTIDMKSKKSLKKLYNEYLVISNTINKYI